MAHAILFTIPPIPSEMLKKLQQIGLAVGAKQDLKKLEETLSTINAVILDAEQKQSTNPQLRLWLEQLQHVLYDVDNVLDSFAYILMQQQLASREKVRHTFTSVKFRFRMSYKIKEIRERLDQIAYDRSQFNLIEGVIDRPIMSREMAHSFEDPSFVMGRDIDKRNIVHLLTCTNIDLNLSIVPIIGIGGVGKTTLAKLVYEDKRVNECFQLKMWLCVSDDFNLQKLTKDINEYVTKGDDCSRLSIDILQTRLRSTIRDKKFLLVLDDVWNENKQRWNEFRQLLIRGAKGSKILVTSRSLLVSFIMGISMPYHLKELSDEDCWSLFAKCAFREGEERKYPELEIIGRQIIYKCKGIPLAVKSLGSMLFMKNNEDDWHSINRSEIWRLEENENGIFPALRLSYNQLPWHLKRCFAFCSFFPKDYKLDRRELIEMWICHGLIPSFIENEELEETGLRYINDLYSRCFFQDMRESYHGTKFKMHDLLHDLALLVAQNEFYTVTKLPMASSSSKKFLECERVSILERNLTNSWNNYKCITKFKFLRTLALSGSGFEVVPGEIGSLKHLRYLDLSCNYNMKKLPDAICKLLHLQILNLGRCIRLEGLPRDIGNLVNLRRLEIQAKEIHLFPNKQIGLLTSLRDLHIVWCDYLVTSFERIDCLSRLRSLRFWYCWNLKSWPGIMKNLPALETLVIQCCQRLNLTNDAFSFPSLRILQLRGLPQLHGLPGWIEGCPNTLHELTIYNCENIARLPNWLQHLASLGKLVIWSCPRISEMPAGISHLTSLKELILNNCSMLNERCKIKGQDWPQISHIPYIEIDRKVITARGGENIISRPEDGP